MGVDKVVIQVGNETDKPKAGDKITTTFTGWLYDPHRASDGYRGKQFDKRESFEKEIGVGKLIKGWEESIVGMTLGEKCMLTIPPELAYGSRRFPGYVPANAMLIFEVELRGINGKMMEAGLVNREDSPQRPMPDLYD